jgi:putative NADH-flavin reductase
VKPRNLDLVAIVDEIEVARFHRVRFNVAH